MDRTAELKRIKRRQQNELYRQRKAGLLPTPQQCQCGRTVLNDRFPGVCSRCAQSRRLYDHQQRPRPRQVRLLAQAVLDELLAEARARGDRP